MTILFLNFAIRIRVLYFIGLDFSITSTDFLQGIYKFIVDWLLLFPGHLGIVSSYEVSDISICCYIEEKWVSSFNILDSIQYSFEDLLEMLDLLFVYITRGQLFLPGGFIVFPSFL